MKKIIPLLLIFFVQCCLPVHAQYWSVTGNSGINSITNFLGTTDNHGLYFRVNNKPSGFMDSALRLTFFGYGAFAQGIAEQVSTNTGFGYEVMYRTHGGSNTGLGMRVLWSNTDGTGNTGVGSGALIYNTTGSTNTSIGRGTMIANTTGSNNIAVGADAMASNTIGGNNSVVGYLALGSNISGNYNGALGGFALYSNSSGGYNNAIGYQALYNNVTGSSNTAVGNYAMVNNNSGISNSALGVYALASNTTGTYNTGNGYSSLYFTTASYYNTAIGYNSGGSYNHGWNNVFLGANTRTSAANFYNDIAIGQDIVCTDVNQVRIGNTATGTIGGYQYWTKFSDGRYKKDVKEDVKGLEFIMKLRPVTYHLDVDALNKKLGRPVDEKGNEIPMDPYTKKSLLQREKEVQTGFIAQEVETAAKQVGYDFEGVDKPGNENSFYGLRYAAFVVPLVKGMQEQQQQLINQQQQLIKQQEELSELKKEIALLKEQNKILTGVTKTN